MKKTLYFLNVLLFFPLLLWGQSSGAGPFTLTAPTSATTGSIQWYKDGILITGSTATTYSATTKGTYWAKYDAGTDAACLGVVTEYATILAESDTDVKTLTGPSGQTGYQWYKDGTAISGATSNTLALTNTTAAVGQYYLSYNNGTCPVSTSNFNVYIITCLAGNTAPVVVTTSFTYP
jgi:hypothetical protein